MLGFSLIFSRSSVFCWARMCDDVMEDKRQAIKMKFGSEQCWRDLGAVKEPRLPLFSHILIGLITCCIWLVDVSISLQHIYIFFYYFRVNGWFWRDSTFFFCLSTTKYIAVPRGWKEIQSTLHTQHTKKSLFLVPIDESRELDVNEATFFFNFLREREMLSVVNVLVVHLLFFFDEWTPIDFSTAKKEASEWAGDRLTEKRVLPYWIRVSRISKDGPRPVFMCFNLGTRVCPSAAAPPHSPRLTAWPYSRLLLARD